MHVLLGTFLNSLRLGLIIIGTMAAGNHGENDNDRTSLDSYIKYYTNNVPFVGFLNQPLGDDQPLAKQNKKKRKQKKRWHDVKT